MRVNLYGAIGVVCFFCLVGLGITHKWTSQWLVVGAGIVLYSWALIRFSLHESDQLRERNKRSGRDSYSAAAMEYDRLGTVLTLMGLVSGLILFTAGNIPLRTNVIDNLALLFISLIAGIAAPRLCLERIRDDYDYRQEHLAIDDAVGVIGGVEVALVAISTVLFLHGSSLIYTAMVITICVLSVSLFELYEDRSFDGFRGLIGLEIAMILAFVGVFIDLELTPLLAGIVPVVGVSILKIVISFSIGIAVPFLVIREQQERS